MERRTRVKKNIIIDDNENFTIEDFEVDEINDDNKNFNKKKYLHKLNMFKKYIVNIICIIMNACSIYILWIILHYISSHFYTKICTPNTFLGFLYSPFIITTPHCRALRWMIFNGSIIIDNMWIVLGTWICSKFIIPNMRA